MLNLKNIDEARNLATLREEQMSAARKLLGACHLHVHCTHYSDETTGFSVGSSLHGDLSSYELFNDLRAAVKLHFTKKIASIDNELRILGVEVPEVSWDDDSLYRLALDVAPDTSSTEASGT